MSRRIVVGRFGAPHGVRGEIRLQSFTREPKAIASYGPLSVPGGRLFTLASVRPVKDDMLVARVVGIVDRAAAAALTGLELCVARDALPPPKDEEFYVADLISLVAYDIGGVEIGTVVAVPNYGGGDLIEVRPSQGGETLLFPFTREIVPTIDLAAGRVVVTPAVEVEDGACDDRQD